MQQKSDGTYHALPGVPGGGESAKPMVVDGLGDGSRLSEKESTRESRAHVSKQTRGHKQLFIPPLTMQAPQDANPASYQHQHATRRVVAHGSARTWRPIHVRGDGPSEASDRL